MDKAQFEKYIEEMREMQKKADIKPTLQKVKTTLHNNSPDMTGEGKLIVNVTSVRGLYPVRGAKVTVFTGEEEEKVVLFEGTTDQSGKTSAIPLPAPAGEYAETPDPAERPYAFYNIMTIADGFYDNLNYNVAVFDDVTSLQNVGLTPIANETPQNRPIIIDEYDGYNL